MSAPARQSIHIGTSGWSYIDWVGPFYPAGTPKSDFLGCYAEHFDVVEVDSTYYAPPSKRLVSGWFERSPEHFRFALKAPGAITHEKALLDCDREADAFFDALAPLGDKLLCVLLQFGYFNKSKFSSADPFLERLDAFLERYALRAPLAVEIRNKAWLTRAYFDLLRRRRAVAALVEHAWLPPIERLIEKHDVVTGPFSYVRLIGDRQGIEQVTDTWDRVVLDRTGDLRRVARSLRRISERVPVYTFVNNHYAGHGPETARALRAEVDRLDA